MVLSRVGDIRGLEGEHAALIRFEDVEPDVCNKYDVANTGYRSCLMA